MFERGQNKTIVKWSYCFIVFLAAIFFGSKSVSAAENNSVVLSEVYPSPNLNHCSLDWCKNEWIELANISDEEITLAGYTIEDQNMHDKEAASPDKYKPDDLSSHKIPAHSLLLLEKTEEKDDFSFTINNKDEKIFLRKDGQIIDFVDCGNLKGQSYAFFGTDGWKWTMTPTPEEENVLMEETVDEDLIKEQIVDEDEAKVEDSPVTVENARNLEDGEEITITGTVTTLPGVLSSQYFYIQDETGGIQVYCYGKTFPTLNLGDVVFIAGELSQINNERRVKIKSVDNIIILNHTDPIVPTETAISSIDEEDEGTYVKTAGIVTETSGNTFYISDGNSEIKVVINKTTGINKPKMKKGDQVEVTGIVSQYKDEYRILPIDQDDVKIVASEDYLPRAGGGELIYPAIGLFITILWNIFLKTKKKLSKLPAIWLLRQNRVIFLP